MLETVLYAGIAVQGSSTSCNFLLFAAKMLMFYIAVNYSNVKTRDIDPMLVQC